MCNTSNEKTELVVQFFHYATSYLVCEHMWSVKFCHLFIQVTELWSLKIYVISCWISHEVDVCCISVIISMSNTIGRNTSAVWLANFPIYNYQSKTAISEYTYIQGWTQGYI